MSIERIAIVLAALSAAVPPAVASGNPLELVATIALPGVRGRIDHFTVDLPGHRLFVAALGNDTVEVLDTAARRHLASLKGFGEPQGVLYLAERKLLFVANGGANRVDILDGRSLAPLKRVDGLPDADNLRFDAAANRVVVGYGGGALRLLEAATGEPAGEIALPAHPESFQMEIGGPRIFVNVPGSRQVAVVDRSRRETIGAWDVAGARANFPMALDEKGRRLFVGARSPSLLLVYDIDSGKLTGKFPIGEDTDDLFFDAKRKRLYVVCGGGQVDVLRQESPDRYVPEATVKTSPGARTGLYVPEEDRLYVAGRAQGSHSAQVFIYSAQ